MDPITIVGLGAKVVDVLMPYVKKGAENLAKEVGLTAVKKVEGILKTLKMRLRGDKTATDMLDEFEKDPETYKPVLEKILQKKVEQDNNFATEMDKNIKDLMNLGFFQRIGKVEKGGKAINVEADEIASGKITATQQIEEVQGEAKNVVVKRIGGL